MPYLIVGMFYAAKSGMKAPTKILLTLLVSCTARADLIDLTPGGFNINEPLPPPVLQFFSLPDGMQYLAGGTINGNIVTWSPFTIFGADQFGIIPNNQSAQVSWNLTNTNGYFMQYILVEGHNSPMDNLYGFTGSLAGRIEGNGSVTIDGSTTINDIVFAGTNVIPDSGGTWLLFGLALMALCFFSSGLRWLLDGIRPRL